ncbi:cation antiporter [Alcanivorax sp. S71-1-4]|uniref:Na+/H+ antiporter subunit E n=1 Tax=Alcanivorax sp. S71-1-4 TaxID=1177159 RepID=UPI0013568110|nr:Na+/H+ antiporter subunit E [Alcanivorax sp. S71-1-4]KAF0810293.1 cation antiporter [Alcanivorax sp. S71-1-4]
MNALTWNIILALIWVGITGEFSSANLVIGFVLGYVILAFAMRDVKHFTHYASKVPKVIRFVGFFVRELVMSNLRVAYDVLTPTHYMRPAVIAVKLEARTDGEITILANLISLTPGTLSLDVSSDRSVLYLHVMYLDDEEAVHASIKALEARVLEILR